jgi:phosphoglycolate phosphatase-like HAD superfamily hydrolase
LSPRCWTRDIAKYFTVVIGGDDVQNKKPHPEPLLLVAEKLSWRLPSCCSSAIRAMIFRRPKRQAAALSA